MTAIKSRYFLFSLFFPHNTKNVKLFLRQQTYWKNGAVIIYSFHFIIASINIYSTSVMCTWNTKLIIAEVPLHMELIFQWGKILMKIKIC